MDTQSYSVQFYTLYGSVRCVILKDTNQEGRDIPAGKDSIMVEEINRYQVKQECNQILREAQVSPLKFTLLYQGLNVVLILIALVCGGDINPVSILYNVMYGGAMPSLTAVFVSILAYLLATVLSAGLTLYFIGIRKRKEESYLTLFDGFSFAGKVILLQIVMSLFIFLWSLLFFIPGIIAGFRYYFAIYNLCENPSIGIMEAIDMSKHQTQGYKMQIFVLQLTFIGWFALGQLPAQFVIEWAESGQMDLIIAMIVSTIWLAAVTLLYLPRLQLMLVSYFNIAKRTSGIGEKDPAEEPAFCDFRDTTYTNDENNPFEQ